MSESNPTIAEVQAEITDLCRRYPAIPRSGIRFLIRETAQEIFDAFYDDGFRAYGTFGRAYFPDRSIFAVALDAPDHNRRVPRGISGTLLGHVGLYSLGDGAKGRLLDLLLDARDAGRMAGIWSLLQETHPQLDPFQQAELAYVTVVESLPQRHTSAGSRSGAKIEQALLDTEEPVISLDVQEILALQSWIEEGLASGDRLVQIHPAQPGDQFNNLGCTLDHARREILEFARQYPAIRKSVQFRVRYSQTGAFENERLNTARVGRLQGAYLPRRQRSLLAVAAHDQPSEFRATLRHELLGHFSTYTFTPGEKRRLLRELIRSREQFAFSDVWAEVDARYPDLPESYRAEEVWATLQERMESILHQPGRGQQLFAEIENRQEPLEWGEWAAVVDWVRIGLADGSRRLQFVPADDRSQFRAGDDGVDLGQEYPTAAEIQAEITEFCREYPAIPRSGVRFLVRNTEEELLDAIDAINPIRELGTIGCAYLPDRSLFASVSSRMGATREQRRGHYLRTLLGKVSFYGFGSEERDRLTERLWQSREQDGIRQLWQHVERQETVTHGRQDQALEVWSLAMLVAADRPVSNPEYGERLWQSIRQGDAGEPFELRDLLALQDQVRAGMAAGHLRVQRGLSVATIEREVERFVQAFPSLGQQMRFLVVQQQEELFDGRFPEAEAGRISGVYYASRSTCGFAAANLDHEAGVQRGLSHECLGHFGLLCLSPEEKRGLLERIVATRGDAAWERAWRNVDRYYPQLSDWGKAEELYALSAEIDDPDIREPLGEDRGAQLWSGLQAGAGISLQPEDLRNLAAHFRREMREGRLVQQIFPATDDAQFQMRPEELRTVANDVGGMDLVLPETMAVPSAEHTAGDWAQNLAKEAIASLPDPRVTRVAVPMRSGSGYLGYWYYEPARLLPDWAQRTGLTQGAENGRTDLTHDRDAGDRPGAGQNGRPLGGQPGATDVSGAGTAGAVADVPAPAARDLGDAGRGVSGGRGGPESGVALVDAGPAARADNLERTAADPDRPGAGADAGVRDGELGVRRELGYPETLSRGTPPVPGVRAASGVVAPQARTVLGARDGDIAGSGSGVVGRGEPVVGSGEPGAGDRGSTVGGGLEAGDEADGSASAVTESALREYPISRALAVLRAHQGNHTNFARTRDGLDARGPKQKARENIEAIRLLKIAALENRFPSDGEREVIARFYGFGGLPQAFPRPDGSMADGWDAVVAELRAVTTPDEYAAIRRSTLDAHYTADIVVEALWAGVERMGMGTLQEPFRVLEPAIGSGVFFALQPESLRRNPHLERMGIELDPISVAVATVLFPEDSIRQAPLQSVSLRRPVDLVIGNPPFGSQKLLDTERPDLTRIAPNTHGYFFAKSLDALNPGGMAALVVSGFLLDANRESHQQFRRWMHRQAELLHAVRLPRTAFAKTAFTEVVTDLLVLRKRMEPLPEDTPDPVWIDGKVELPDLVEGESVSINGWYREHPECLLGTPSLGGKMYGAGREKDFTLDPLPDRSLEDLLEERFVARLPQDGFGQWQPRPGDRIEGPELPEIAREQVGRVQPYGYFVVPAEQAAILRTQFGATQSGLQIARRRPDDFEGNFAYTLVEEKNARHFPRLAGMVGLRDTALALLEQQLDGRTTDAQLQRLRDALNRQYDAFQKEFGYLNAPGNARELRGDPGSSLVLGLERDYDKGLSREVAKRTGEAPRKPSAVKSDLFRKRTQFPIRPVSHADSVQDALFIALAESGSIDWQRVCSLTGRTWDQVAGELRLATPAAMAFETPAGSWEERSAYLSGDIPQKIEAVEAALQEEAREERRKSLQASRDALLQVRPQPIPAELITVHPGAPYVPIPVVSAFLEAVGLTSVTVQYVPYTGQWVLRGTGTGEAAQAYQTSRRSVSKLVEDLFNHRSPIIYDTDVSGNRHVAEEDTALAVEKVNALRDRWQEWIREDPERLQSLADEYNHRFNRIVRREYDGRHLTLPGAASGIELRPHQKNAVWRSCQSKSVLFDHKVGAGKTFAAVAAVMEKRRMGQVRKPIVTVPNHLVGQWASAWLTLYPSARILVADEQDMDSQHRQEFLAKAAYNDWDAVIISHSAFKLVPVDPEFYERFLHQEVAQIEDLLRTMPDLETVSVKQLEKKRQSLQERARRMHERVNARRDQGMLHFGEIGFDYIVNDESHMHKNVPYMTLLKNVSGLGNPAGSERAEDMFVKVAQAREAGAGVLFLTGTPISNTIAEMYLLTRYLDPQLLEDQGLYSFDAWVSTFATVKEEFAFTLTGQFKSRKSLSEFNDVPTLVEQYKSFSDIIGQEDIDRLLRAEGKKAVPLPVIRGGKPQIVTCPMSAEQREIVGVEVGVNALGEPQYANGSILHRLDNLPSKPGPGEDNILVIINDLKKVSLDARAFDPAAPASATGKIPNCVERIHEIYQRSDADRGAQLVYLDFSTPKGARGKLSPELREILDLVATVDAGEDEEASDLERSRAEVAAETLEKYSPMEVEEARRMAQGQQVWSAYDEIRAQLVARGIPNEEIAFIHDANTDLRKEELFGKVRSGAVRVLLGSTGKMGPGMNVQDRLVGIHHLDAPYRPSDVEQRNGRIIRQGNKLLEKYGRLEVEVLYYVTENSSDAGLWQILETKDKFINSIRFASGSRTASDPDAQAMDPAAVKAMASGHELLMTEVPLRARLRNLERLEKAYQSEQWVRSTQLDRVRRRMAKFEEERDAWEQETRFVTEWEKEVGQRHAGAEEPLFVWDGEESTRERINKAIRASIETLYGYTGTRHIELGVLEGFRVAADRDPYGNDTQLVLRGPHGTVIRGKLFQPKASTDHVQRVLNLIRYLPRHQEDRGRQFVSDQEEEARLSGAAGQGFGRHQEMAVVREQHQIAETLMRLRIRKWSAIAETFEAIATTPDSVSRNVDLTELAEEVSAGRFASEEAARDARVEAARAVLRKEAQEKAQEYIDRARLAFSQPPLTAANLDILAKLGVSEEERQRLRETHGFVSDDEAGEVPAVEMEETGEPGDGAPDFDDAAGMEETAGEPEPVEPGMALEGTETGLGEQRERLVLPERDEAVTIVQNASGASSAAAFPVTPSSPALPGSGAATKAGQVGESGDLFGGDLFSMPPAAARAPLSGGGKPPQEDGALLAEIAAFLSRAQREVTRIGLRGPDAAFFREKVREIAEIIAQCPGNRETDGQGKNAIAHLHYFTGSADWYITELNREEAGEISAFGLADLGMGFPELGYLSLQEVLNEGAELDYHFSPRSLQYLLNEEHAAPETPPAPSEVRIPLDRPAASQWADQPQLLMDSLHRGYRLRTEPVGSKNRITVERVSGETHRPVLQLLLEDPGSLTVFPVQADARDQLLLSAHLILYTSDPAQVLADLGQPFPLAEPAAVLAYLDQWQQGLRDRSGSEDLQSFTQRVEALRRRQVVSESMEPGLAALLPLLPEHSRAEVEKAGTWSALQTPEMRDRFADLLDHLIALRAGQVATALQESGWIWGGVSFTNSRYPGYKIFPNGEGNGRGNNVAWGYIQVAPGQERLVLTDDFRQTDVALAGHLAGTLPAPSVVARAGEGNPETGKAERLPDDISIPGSSEQEAIMADIDARDSGNKEKVPQSPTDLPGELFYRGGPESSVPNVNTIYQIIDYERLELDNQIDVTQIAIDNDYLNLSTSAVRSLQWLTMTPEEAAEYGRVTTVYLQNPVFLATDLYGGVLVAEKEELDQALRLQWQEHPTPSLESAEEAGQVAEEEFVELDADDLGELDAAVGEPGPKPDWVTQSVDEGGLFRPFEGKELSKISGSLMGILPTQMETTWTLPNHSGWRAAVQVARALDGQYRISTSMKAPNFGTASPIRMWGVETFASLDEAVLAGRKILVDALQRQHASETRSQEARGCQGLANLVAGQPGGMTVLLLPDAPEEVPEREQLANLRQRQQEVPTLTVVLSWAQHFREKPFLEVAITADTIRAIDSENRTLVHEPLTFDPLDDAAWNRFRRSIAVSDPQQSEILTNAPYGMEGDLRLRIERPLALPEDRGDRDPAAFVWPEDPATAELPVEEGPFSLGNMDRFAALRWEDADENFVQFAIGRSAQGYHSALGLRLGRYSMSRQPNVRTGGDHDRPARATFAEALADLDREWKRTFARERQTGLSVDQAALLESVQQERSGQEPSIRAQRLGVDEARLESRDLEDVQEVSIRLSHAMTTHAQTQGVSAGREWILEGRTPDGSFRYLGTWPRWGRLLEAQAAAFRHLTPRLEESAVAEQRNTPQGKGIATTEAAATVAGRYLVVQDHRSKPLQLGEPTVVQEIDANGVSGTFEGFDNDLSVLRISGSWYRHPHIEHWLHSGMFAASGWETQDQMLDRMLALQGKEIAISRTISQAEPLRGQTVWMLSSDSRVQSRKAENHLIHLQDRHRALREDAEALRAEDASVLLDFQYTPKVRVVIHSPQAQALVLEMSYRSGNVGDPLVRQARAFWVDDGGNQGMEFPLSTAEQADPVAWLAQARARIPEWEEQGVTQERAITGFETALRAQVRQALADLEAVPLAPVVGNESLTRYLREMNSSAERLTVWLREQTKHLASLGVSGSDARMQSLYARPAYQESVAMGDRVEMLRSQATKKARQETIQRGKHLRELLPADAPVEDMAQAVFLSHGIESQRTPDIVAAVRERRVEEIQKLIGRNSGNPASQEIFTRMTGIALGKTQKERVRIIDEWGAAQPPAPHAAPSRQAEVPQAPDEGMRHESPLSPDELLSESGIAQSLRQSGFVASAHREQAGRWVEEYQLPDRPGLLQLSGQGADLSEAILRVEGVKIPEAIHDLLQTLRDAGVEPLLRRAELVHHEVLSGIETEHTLVVDRAALDRVQALQGLKGLEIVGTLGAFADAQEEADSLLAAKELLGEWQRRFSVPVSLTLLLDPAQTSAEPATLQARLGVDHLQRVPDAELRQAPLNDWIRAADFVVVLGAPLEHPLASALIDHSFRGEKKDLNKATACILGDQVLWHREPLLELASRKARYKALDNDRLARSREASGQPEPPVSVPLQPEVPAAGEVRPVAAESPAVDAVQAPERPRVSADAQESEQPSAAMEAVAPASEAALAMPEAGERPEAGDGQHVTVEERTETPMEESAADEVLLATAAQESEQPPAAMEVVTPESDQQERRAEDPSWPEASEVTQEIRLQEGPKYDLEAQHLEAMAAALQRIDWQAMVRDLAAQRGDDSWDARESCVRAREWLKDRDPMLWGDAVHYHFEVANNPVKSPAIHAKGRHDLIGFGNFLVVDPWVPLTLGDGKPFVFPVTDDAQAAVLANLYGDARLWEVYDRKVRNQKDIALPEPTDVVSEREILLALDRIQESPQWAVLDPRTVECWLDRAVQVVTKEHQGLKRMADSGWIPISEADLESLLSRSRLQFQVAHALYPAASGMGELLTPSGQIRMWREQLLQELPAMKSVDMLRGSLHESAILQEVDHRHPSWERITPEKWPGLPADLEDALPEVMLNLDALYREVQEGRTVWHVVDAKSPRARPDAVEEAYLVQLNFYGEGLRRALAALGTEEPEIHLHLAYGVLAEGRTYLVEVPRDPQIVSPLLNALETVNLAVVSGLPPRADERPMPAEQEEELWALLSRYEARKVEAQVVSLELQDLHREILARQAGYAPVSLLDDDGTPRARLRRAAPTLNADDDQEWFRLAAATGIDASLYERPAYDQEALLTALREQGVDVAAWQLGSTLDVANLKTAIKATGGIPESEWQWRIDLVQTKAAKKSRQELLAEIQQRRSSEPTAEIQPPTQGAASPESTVRPEEPLPTPVEVPTAPARPDSPSFRHPRRP